MIDRRRRRPLSGILFHAEPGENLSSWHDRPVRIHAGKLFKAKHAEAHGILRRTDGRWGVAAMETYLFEGSN